MPNLNNFCDEFHVEPPGILKSPVHLKSARNENSPYLFSIVCYCVWFIDERSPEMAFSPEGPIMVFLLNITRKTILLNILYLDESFTIRLGTYSISADLKGA